MLNTKHYVPMMKWKAAEKKALVNLYGDHKIHITPLIQITMPSPKPPSKGAPKKTDEQIHQEVLEAFEKKIPKIAEEISKSWGGNSIFIDFSLIYTTQKITCIETVLQKGSELGLKLIPVVNLSDDASLKGAIYSAAQKYNSGFCIRIVTTDLKNSVKLNSELEDIVKITGIARSDVDLLIDIKEAGEDYNDYLTYVNQSQKIQHLSDWRNFIFASGSFPVDLSKCALESENLIDRNDWKNWLKQRETAGIVRCPTFADYTIQHPIYNTASQFHHPTTSIKYTLENQWLVLKGKQKDYKLYLAHAKTLFGDERYFGESFSFGDGYIKDRAGHFETYMRDPSIKGTGSTETWLAMGISHHLAQVASQVSILS